MRPLSAALVSTQSQSACYFYFGRKDVKVSFNHRRQVYPLIKTEQQAETRKVKSKVKGQNRKEIFKNKINKMTVPEGGCEKDMVD